MLFCLVINERPLPPIPKEESADELMLPSFSWFHDLERNEAERMLKQIATDGVYLVRRSKRAGLSSPYTLTLYHNGRIFHLNVRRRTDGLYALGMEKYKEKVMSTVCLMSSLICSLLLYRRLIRLLNLSSITIANQFSSLRKVDKKLISLLTSCKER